MPCQSPYVVIHMRHMPHASTVRNIRTPAQTNPANVVEGSPASIDPHRLPLLSQGEFVGVSNRAAHYVISSCTVDNYTPIGEHLFDITRSACRQRTGIGGAL